MRVISPCCWQWLRPRCSAVWKFQNSSYHQRHDEYNCDTKDFGSLKTFWETHVEITSYVVDVLTLTAEKLLKIVRCCASCITGWCSVVTKHIVVGVVDQKQCVTMLQPIMACPQQWFMNYNMYVVVTVISAISRVHIIISNSNLSGSSACPITGDEDVWTRGTKKRMISQLTVRKI